MKKVLCVVPVALIFATTSFAQHTQFGVKAGVNLSSVKISDGEDYDSKTGIHFGGLAHIHLSQHWAIQPELVFSMQGGQDESNDQKLKLNYINVPVLVQYMFDEGFRLQTGPQIGFLVSAKNKIGDVEYDADDQIESIDFAWVFGGSYLFPQGLGIDVRYNHGISNISDVSGFEAHNRVFQLGLFYQFNRARK